jgi:hypothetical protein
MYAVCDQNKSMTKNDESANYSNDESNNQATNQPVTHYHRKGFGLKDVVEVELKKVYESDLIAKLRASGNVMTVNGCHHKISRSFWFLLGCGSGRFNGLRG